MNLLSVSLLKLMLQTEHLFVAMIVFMALIVGVTILIALFMLRRLYHFRKRSYLKKILNDLVSEIAICETREETELLLADPDFRSGIEVFIKKKKYADILISKLSEACASIKGSSFENLVHVYEYFDLQKFTVKDLREGKWYRKVRAMQHLARFRQFELLPSIVTLIDHQNMHVRSEALIALVRLEGFDGLKYFINSKFALSEWQQICLLDELSFHQLNDTEPISKLLSAENVSMAGFGKKLAKEYQCFELIEEEEVWMS